MSDKVIEATAKKAAPGMVSMPCLECGKLWWFDPDSNEVRGIFNVFCSDKDCEDKYAWKQ